MNHTERETAVVALLAVLTMVNLLAMVVMFA